MCVIMPLKKTSILKPLISAIKVSINFPLEEKQSGDHLDFGHPFLLVAHRLDVMWQCPLRALGSHSLYDFKSSLNPYLLVLLYPVPELEGTNTDLKDQSKAFEWVTNSLFSPHQLFPGLRVRLDKKNLPHQADAKPNFNNSFIGPF